MVCRFARRPGAGGRCLVAGEFTDVTFLTVAEVAALMRVSRMTVYRLVHAGRLPALRVGKSFRVPEAAVHDYLRQSFVDTA
jgi:excisionase family DNA binding protein